MTVKICRLEFMLEVVFDHWPRRPVALAATLTTTTTTTTSTTTTTTTTKTTTRPNKGTIKGKGTV